MSTGGWMPRARSRSSTSAALGLVVGLGEQLRARLGVVCRAAPRARPRSIASATSRACAPSCRSRSMRRSSAAAASTAPARVRSSSSTRSSSSSPRGGRSSACASAPVAAAGPRPGQARSGAIAMPIAVAASAVQMFVMWKRPRSAGSFASHSAHVQAGAKISAEDRARAPVTAIGEPRDADRQQRGSPSRGRASSARR